MKTKLKFCCLFVWKFIFVLLFGYIVSLNQRSSLMQKSVVLMWYLRLALDKIQAISFKVVKACYPFTIKGWLFSLLCCQPEAVPVYLKALTPLITLRCQYLPLIWNGQAKAQPPNRFILSLTNTIQRLTHNVTESKLSWATPIYSVFNWIYSVSHRYLTFISGSKKIR